MPGPSPWTHLDRSGVADGLSQIVQNPRWINQRLTPLCGPSAFFNVVAGRHPVAFARAATTLFNTGKCMLGGLSIAPNSKLLTADYGNIVTSSGAALPSGVSQSSWQAVWMLVSSLKNVTMEAWQSLFSLNWVGNPQDQVAGISPPGEVEGWFKSTGFFTTVDNHANWNTNQGIPQAEGLNPAAIGADISILINANLLYSAGVPGAPVDNNVVMRSIANHWVILVGEVVGDVTKDLIYFSVWSWGSTNVGLSVPSKVFLQNYYGSVTTTVQSKGS
jgi:hypothetical protein